MTDKTTNNPEIYTEEKINKILSEFKQKGLNEQLILHEKEIEIDIQICRIKLELIRREKEQTNS